MKSPVVGGAKNVNMKGKKIKKLRCGCCIAYDFRDKYKEISDKNLMKNHNKFYCD